MEMKIEQASINEKLPFLLKRENIARYENGKVMIGDRRKFPFERSFVTCSSAEEVASAIKSMVTQGGGQWIAAAYAMLMRAEQLQGKPAAQVRRELETARNLLTATRPTNTSLARNLERLMQAADQALASGNDLAPAMLSWIEAVRDRSYERSAKIGRFGADLIADGDGILTMCFAETSFMLTLVFAKEDGKSFHVFTPETRPYLQGARLTAPSVHELGIPVELITDNMPAYIMSQGKVQRYFTAADLVTMNGHVVNKIGTFQNAITAHYHGIPYFVLSQGPDARKPDRASIVVEERDPAEVRASRGVPTTTDDIPAYYPAFDITPPYLVSGIITEYGILNPYDLKRYYGTGGDHKGK
jgi:methylthioribose-1-phosphate isomerase